MSQMTELDLRVKESADRLKSLAILMQRELEEIACILNTISNSTSGTPTIETLEYTELMNKLTGPDGIFVQYLAPSLIMDGKGKLEVCGYLHQYTEDVFALSMERLQTWPMGFYRNSNTMETQMLVRTTNFLILLDKLPSNNNTIKIYRRFTANENYLELCNKPTEDDITLLLIELDPELIFLTEQSKRVF
jgi:hypothetical protein